MANLIDKTSWIFGISPLTGEPVTQIRRMVRPNEYTWVSGWRELAARKIVNTYSEICHPNGNQRFERNRIYHVAARVGARAEGRIILRDMWREDLRNISTIDALACGYETPLRFLQFWVRKYDYSGRWYGSRGDTFNVRKAKSFEILSESELWERLKARPAYLFKAWALEFEVVSDDH